MRNAFLLKRYLKECNYNFRLVKTNYRYSTKKSLSDTKKKFCVEIQFMLNGNEKYDYCWMGKMWSKGDKKDIYIESIDGCDPAARIYDHIG